MARGIMGVYIYVCDEKLRKYFAGHIPAYKTARISKPKKTVVKVFPFEILPPEEARKYKNSVPVFDLKAAAGGFSPSQIASHPGWVRLPEISHPQKDLFVCQVIGESMNKKIPNGSWCVFSKNVTDVRDGDIVLVEHSKIQDDIGSGYTIKEYHSKKRRTASARANIVLKPKSNDPSFRDIVLTPEDNLTKLKIRGVLVKVLK